MAKKKTVFDRMKDNPKNDWDINDIKKLCDECEIALEPPTTGSHYKVVSPVLEVHVTVPTRRPIKPFYIKELINYITAHRHIKKRENEKTGEGNG